eukprot:TRINITY_DN2118_c0_g1_i5.p1 TRINITY_DN2118_c0_g1~~TRINITY_DN2118_c0_g1_i5.p1  ORF type:complete len:354 (-),score=67.46 TRINITY_DN2118_c0_g1_i5:429-1490(-)
MDLSPSKLDQKLLLLGIVTHGAKLSRNFELAESLHQRARDIFTRLFGYSSLDSIKAIFLLGIYCFSMGRYDESVCYLALNNQLLSMMPTANITEEIGSLYSHIIGIILATTQERQDRNYLYMKGRKFASKPFDHHKLTLLYTHGEITHSLNPDETYDLDQMCSMLDQGEEFLKIAGLQDCYTVAQYLAIWAHRSAAYLKAGVHDLCVEWATKATELAFDTRLEYHLPCVMVAIGLVTKINLQVEHVSNLEQNLKTLSMVSEHFPFLKCLMGKVRTVLSRYNLSNEDYYTVYEDEHVPMPAICSMAKFFDIPPAPSSPLNSPPLDPVILAIADSSYEHLSFSEEGIYLVSPTNI